MEKKNQEKVVVYAYDEEIEEVEEARWRIQMNGEKICNYV